MTLKAQKARNEIHLDDCKSYATEANLEKALSNLGLDDWRESDTQMPCRYIKCRNAEGRWTAVFLVQEYFNVNKTGGYVGFAAQHGFMSI
jgi:hypothetical protein